MPLGPIKVLTIGRFYPPNHGGIERHIHELLCGIGKSIQADCIVVDNNKIVTDVTTSLPYRLYKAPSIGTIASTSICPTLPSLVRKLYKENQYDIVHLHFPNPMAHLAAYFLPKNVKLVITWHSDIIKQKRLLKFYSPFLRDIIQRADAIIAGTPTHFSSFEQLTPWANPSRLFVVPYGINANNFALNSSENTAVLAVKEKYRPKKIIFAIGRHVYYKGFEYLIQAMKNIPDAVLLLGGKGPLTEQLKNMVTSLQLENKVIFLGHIPEEQLPIYYHAADVFCLPSVEKSEAFGLVQLEAMACKKPIVCCELNNGVTFVNQHTITGLVVPPRNPLALAQAINTLLSDEKLRYQMGINSYNRVINEFSQEKMWQETLNVYNKILQQK